MNYIDIDLHVHTSASFDSYNRIAAILNKSINRELNIIAITDHNSIECALAGKEIISKYNKNIYAIIGEEISTDKGEIIGLFLKKYVNPGKLEVVINEIKSQEGIIYLPHPYKRSEIVFESIVIEHIDIIEIWNNRCNYEQNYKAMIFAVRHNKLMGCGSDSHLLREIGGCKMSIETDYKKIDDLDSKAFLNLMRNSLKITITGNNTNYIKHECLSQIIKSFKRLSLSPYQYIIRYIPREIISNIYSPKEIYIVLEKKGDSYDYKIKWINE